MFQARTQPFLLAFIIDQCHVTIIYSSQENTDKRLKIRYTAIKGFFSNTGVWNVSLGLLHSTSPQSIHHYGNGLDGSLDCSMIGVTLQMTVDEA